MIKDSHLFAESMIMLNFKVIIAYFFPDLETTFFRVQSIRRFEAFCRPVKPAYNRAILVDVTAVFSGVRASVARGFLLSLTCCHSNLEKKIEPQQSVKHDLHWNLGILRLKALIAFPFWIYVSMISLSGDFRLKVQFCQHGDL